MRVRMLLPALLAAATLTMTGCGSDGGESGGAKVKAEEAGAGSGKDDSSDSSSSGAKAPASLRFTGKTLEGKTFKGESLAGKPVLLWFWAPWCGTCQAQAKETAQVAVQFEGKANVLGVAGLDKEPAMKKFVSDRKVSVFPHLSDERGTVWKKFKVTQQSTYVLLDKNGKTAYTGSLAPGGELADKVGKLVG